MVFIPIWDISSRFHFIPTSSMSFILPTLQFCVTANLCWNAQVLLLKPILLNMLENLLVFVLLGHTLLPVDAPLHRTQPCSSLSVNAMNGVALRKPRHESSPVHQSLLCSHQLLLCNLTQHSSPLLIPSLSAWKILRPNLNQHQWLSLWLQNPEECEIQRMWYVYSWTIWWI